MRNQAGNGSSYQKHASTHLDPRCMQTHGFVGYVWWFWAILLHTLGVQVEPPTTLNLNVPVLLYSDS